ncbi:MAG: class I SAM-dependent methyltransferase [Betaproteobacteria bacterium]|nr:class I SAM-dependent methyltransferase [Betaproteobacteria bacterium]
MLDANIRDGIDWLDLGCGHSVLPKWRHESEIDLISRCRVVFGLDFDLNSLKKHATISARIRGDIARLPFPESSFDLVTANMVVEHLDDPETQFKEVFRVLRPGGKFIFHTMNVRGYYTVCARLIPERMKGKMVMLLQERKEDDLFRTHYLANSEVAISRLSEAAGFSRHVEMLFNSFPQFRVVPPLVVFELLWIKLLMADSFRRYRSNVISIMEK